MHVNMVQNSYVSWRLSKYAVFYVVRKCQSCNLMHRVSRAAHEGSTRAVSPPIHDVRVNNEQDKNIGDGHWNIVFYLKLRGICYMGS